MTAEVVRRTYCDIKCGQRKPWASNKPKSSPEQAQNKPRPGPKVAEQ